MAYGFWIAYVYLALLLIMSFVRITIAFARERGIAAYRAWARSRELGP